MHDVFISYSSRNKEIADAICHHLEAAGAKCWYAPRDVTGGDTWAASIVRAIGEAKVFVLIYSEESNRSDHVLREVSHAASKGCSIIPFRVDGTMMNDNLAYYLQSLHWLDAMTPPLERNIEKLCKQTLVMLNRETPAPVTPVPEQKARKPRKKWIPAAIAAALLLCGAALLLGKPAPEPAPEETQITEEAAVQDMELMELSQVGGYRYPFFETAMFTTEMDLVFLENEETGTLSLVKTDTGFRTIKDLEYDFSDRKYVFLSARSTSDYLHFMEWDTSRVKIYDRGAGAWVSREGIQLELSDTEYIFTSVYNRADMTAEEDHSDNLGVILYDSREDLQCLSRIVYFEPDGSYNQWDISQYGLTDLVAGIDRSDVDYVLVLNRENQVKLLDVENGLMPDISHETLLADYLPYASADRDVLSPGGRYLRLTTNRNGYWEPVIWDLHTGRQVFSETFTKNYSLYFSSEDQILYYNFEDYSLRSCDLTTGEKKLLLNKDYFESHSQFPDFPYTFVYSEELDACFFSVYTYSEETEQSYDRLVMTDLEGNILAESGPIEMPVANYTPYLYFEENKLFYLLVASDLEQEFENEICTVIYRTMYSKDETGKIRFLTE